MCQKCVCGRAGGADSAHQTSLAGLKAPTSKGRGGHGRGGEEREGDGRERKGTGAERGKEGKGSCRYFFFPTSSPDVTMHERNTNGV